MDAADAADAANARAGAASGFDAAALVAAGRAVGATVAGRYSGSAGGGSNRSGLSSATAGAEDAAGRSSAHGPASHPLSGTSSDGCSSGSVRAPAHLPTEAAPSPAEPAQPSAPQPPGPKPPVACASAPPPSVRQSAGSDHSALEDLPLSKMPVGAGSRASRRCGSGGGLQPLQGSWRASVPPSDGQASLPAAAAGAQQQPAPAPIPCQPHLQQEQREECEATGLAKQGHHSDEEVEGPAALAVGTAAAEGAAPGGRPALLITPQSGSEGSGGSGSGGTAAGAKRRLFQPGGAGAGKA